MDVVLLRGLLTYLGVVNLVSLVLIAVDKVAAVDRSWRISETTISIVSLIEGVWGTIADMILFRHETQKIEFQGVVAFIGLLNLLGPYQLLMWALTGTSTTTSSSVFSVLPHHRVIESSTRS